MTERAPFQDSAGRWRDGRGKFITAPPPPPVPVPLTEYRIVTFGTPRSPWRKTKDAAMGDAIRLHLASWDESRREHYLAVPVSMQSRTS